MGLVQGNKTLMYSKNRFFVRCWEQVKKQWQMRDSEPVCVHVFVEGLIHPSDLLDSLGLWFYW